MIEIPKRSVDPDAAERAANVSGWDMANTRLEICYARVVESHHAAMVSP
jgi:hypothetical protein